MITPDHIAEVVKQFFADRKHIPTVNEMNELLLAIVSLSAQDYCRTRFGEGATRDEINAELGTYLASWGEWQRETREKFAAFLREPWSPAPKLQ